MNFTVIRGYDLNKQPALRDSMFKKRKEIFVDKLNWSLNMDKYGREIDEYDELNPLYIIVTDSRNRITASCRIMPTTGRHMLSEKFPQLLGEGRIHSPTIWETTRFFISQEASRCAAPALMWAGCELAQFLGIKQYLGVTGAQLVRVFAACGWAPKILGRGESGGDEICACIWEVTAERSERLRRLAKLGDENAPAQFRIVTSSTSTSFEPMIKAKAA